MNDASISVQFVPVPVLVPVEFSVELQEQENADIRDVFFIIILHKGDAKVKPHLP